MLFVRVMILGVFMVAWSSPVFATDRLTIYTVNYPLAYFAERIGGEQIEVVFPAPDDADPAYWMPDQATIAAYQQADLILLNGASYARWVGKVSLPRGKMVDTSRTFKDRYVVTQDVLTHSHGAASAHAHESLASTTWLDFSLARLQAEAIFKAMARKRPTAEMTFKQNYQVLAKELEGLDRQIREIVGTQSEYPLLGSHPVYEYLAAGYGLNLKSLHWEPNVVPPQGAWLELQRVQQEQKAGVMLWEGEPLAETVTALKSLGIDSVVFNPCGNRPERGDFMSVMRQNITVLKESFL